MASQFSYGRTPTIAETNEFLKKVKDSFQHDDEKTTEFKRLCNIHAKLGIGGSSTSQFFPNLTHFTKKEKKKKKTLSLLNLSNPQSLHLSLTRIYSGSSANFESGIMATEEETKQVFDVERAGLLVEELRTTFKSGKTKIYEWRISQLKNIAKMVEEKEKEIIEALHKDLLKPEIESFISEFFGMGDLWQEESYPPIYDDSSLEWSIPLIDGSNRGFVLNEMLILNATMRVLHSAIEYGLERINWEVSHWMKGLNESEDIPSLPFRGYDSVVWNRLYSRDTSDLDDYQIKQINSVLEETLEAVGAKAMVVGHTPQFDGVNCKYNCSIWRIDVGMSSGVLNSRPEVLEINDNNARVLRSKSDTFTEHQVVDYI